MSDKLRKVVNGMIATNPAASLFCSAAALSTPSRNVPMIWKRNPNLVKGFIETELWDSVRKITAPTLYVIGGASRIVPPETQQKLKDTLPHVRIVVMPGLGHYPDEEDTAGFMKIVQEFLQT